jgi:hypothetical protein
MRVREAIAAGFVRFGHVRSEQNIADIMTKPLGPIIFHLLAHPYLFRHLNSFQANAPLMAHQKGVHFWGSISPSKIDPKEFY